MLSAIFLNIDLSSLTVINALPLHPQNFRICTGP